MITNKRIVITGASSGIGKAILEILAQGEGNRIIAAARNVDVLEGYRDNVIPFSADLSKEEGVDSLFDKISQEFGYADLYFCNAGAPYYEKFDYENWDRIKYIIDLNTVGHIYTYAKYLNQLNGRPGHIVFTISAMGEMATPGFALYATSKFAMKGFQEAIRYEKPENLMISSVYPVSTNTNFFNVAANGVKITKPFPVQEVDDVAESIVAGVEAGKAHIYPCSIFRPSKVMMKALPPVKLAYISIEKNRLKKHIKNLADTIDSDVKTIANTIDNDVKKLHRK